MDYQQTLDYLFEQLPMYHRIGAAAYKANLDNTIEICRLLNNPQDQFKSVHIAGTNGKGSVSHYLASIFQECGYKTGLYTSPHLKDFRERIRINGKMIPETNVVGFVEKYRTEFKKIKPSFFEWTVGLAFDYFRNEKVDIAIIETGLGGRLDSTNVINPEVSVITNISLDHSNLLGNTLEKIALEKAGIIKENIPFVVGETQHCSSSVFNAVSKEKKAEIFYADKMFRAKDINQQFGNKPFLELTIKAIDETYPKKIIKIISELAGIYQVKNIITAFAAIEILITKGYRIKPENTLKGFEKVIENTEILGRWQKLSDNPLAFCDTGHNEEGIREILCQLKKIPYKKLHWVFGMVNDKDISKILSILPKDAEYYFCRADVPRALSDSELYSNAGKYDLKGASYGTVRNAYNKAKTVAQNDDLILIGGSTFVVAEVI
ncbi:MAG: folylpolyglutamate synthase/dihydrofolate synthase family protein [Bacteroidota bacterium]